MANLHGMRRRHFLTLSAASVGGLLIYTLDRRPERVAAQGPKVRVPLRFFTEDEARLIAAAAARILPTDEAGPGASEAGVVIYIDRQLGAPYGADRYRYTQPPFAEGVPEQGYQSQATPREIYRTGLKLLEGFDRLGPAEQDARLKPLESNLFFRLLRTHTIEGMFCDPMHGGNLDMIGWQLIGFPGPRMSYREEVDRYHGRAFRPKPASLEQVIGRKVRPSEDEESVAPAVRRTGPLKRLPEVDALVVGGGWVGLLIAKELAARTALSILVLERGGPRKTSDYIDDMDELDYAIRLRMTQDIAAETVTFRHNPRDRALPVRQYGSFLPGSGVGGAGEHWSGISFRYAPDAFVMRTRWLEKYGGKRLPEEHAIQDWGVTYGELEPHYDRIEKLMGISGKAGNLRDKQIEGGNIFEGPRSSEYPTPPMKMPYLAALFHGASKSLGYHPYPLPAATNSVAYRNPDGVWRAGCAYCGYCERFGCMIGAKAQPTNTLLPVLAKQRNATVRTHAWVRRVVVEAGRARGVVYVDQNGGECFQPAGMVFLASWTLNNTRLLLLSGIGEPYEPATGHGLVGRNLTHQVSIPAAMAFFEKPLNRFMGAGSAGVAISDFEDHAFDHRGVPFVGGGFIYTVCYGFRPMANFGVVPPGVQAAWGSAWKKAALEWYDRTGRISFYGDHLSYRGNYMDLDPTYTDRHGDPLLRLTLDWRENERRMAEFMTGKAVEIAWAMGAREIAPFRGLRRYDATRYQSTHIQGGAIMGATPEQSVINPYQQHWQVDNLFVLGASAFPQNPCGNPTLTALALASRTADAVVARSLKKPGPLV